MSSIFLIVHQMSETFTPNYLSRIILLARCDTKLQNCAFTLKKSPRYELVHSIVMTGIVEVLFGSFFNSTAIKDLPMSVL